ncbi:MAG TPA: hypothetical protein DCG90_06380 [Sphingobium sp.]|uniref:DUF7684 family protein n=1 Tax=Sphingobium sp. TaxID=1912891 RepID=UPI000ED92B4E|nr:hypothetical protein [Sphingobium sp.]HAF41382.1 hypothetical protein [Sphingobium sp.]
MKLDYLHVSPDQPMPHIKARPDRAILIAERPVSQAWRDDVAAWLVSSGCLYFVTWGEACEGWHDAVDWAALKAFDFGEIPDDKFVMTTWHNKEPLSETLWFAGNCASHPDVDLTETVIVHVSAVERRAEILALYRDSQDAENGT